MSRGGGKPGAVKITLHSNNNDIGEKAEVTVAIKDPEHAVERMLHTLAQRFPPESVVTIAPAKGVIDQARGGDTTSSSSSGVPTSTEGSRSSSFSGELSGGPTLALSPALRRGMATLSPELSGWVLANNPVIFPGLLDLATRGGDPKEFAARMGLSPEPVETVVHQLTQDPDFFEWLSQLAQQTSAKPTKRAPAVRRAHTQPVRTGYPGGLPPPAVGMVLKDPNFPKQGFWLVDQEGNVVGHSDVEGNHVIHPVTRSTNSGGILYPYAPLARPPVAGTTIPRDLTSVPKDPLHPEDGSWLVNREGRVVGHTNSIGRIVMHPVSDLGSRPSQSSGFAGLNVVPRDPAHAEDGGPWLVDSSGRVVGHYDQKGRPVMHPIVVDPKRTSFLGKYEAVPINPTQPTDGSWLIGRSNKIVGHTDASQNLIMHPQGRLPLKEMKSSGVPELHMIPRDALHPENGGPWLVDTHGNVIGHYDRERRPVMHPANPIPTPPSQPSRSTTQNLESWVRDPSGKVTGHLDPNGKQVSHPRSPLSLANSRPSGLPGVYVVESEGGRPWLVDQAGNVVGHYDKDQRVVIHPSSTTPQSPVPGFTMRPISPSRPLEGCWLLNPAGRIVGHTDPSNSPIFHPTRPLNPSNGHPSGLPGVFVVNRDPSRPEDGGPWLVDGNGNVVGHYDPEGRAVLQPLGFESTLDIEPDMPYVPMDPSNPRGPAWVVDGTTGLVIGHVEQPGQAPIHHVVNALAHPARPSGVTGVNIIDGPVPWLVDQRGQVLGHLSPEGRARFHPLLPMIPLTNLHRSSTEGVSELPMDRNAPEKGIWLLDSNQQVVGHQLPTERSVMHPTMKFAAEVARPTGVQGLRRVAQDPMDPSRRVSWACDDEGNLLGHFDPHNGTFRLHPRSPRPVTDFGAAAPVLVEIPKVADHPELGSWLISRDGFLVGHTDLKERPVMHPQRPFPKTAMVPVGIAGVSLVSRDPQHPELGGPWLVGDDGFVIGHFEPEGRPLLHPNFKSRLTQPVPSPVVGYQAAYIDPEKATDGVWLIDSDGLVVGHAGLDGTVEMHPQEPLANTVSSNLRGLSIAQRNPSAPHQGGPWVVDFNGNAVGHYGPDGRLILHPQNGRPIWDTNSPPQSVVSQTIPSRGASSAGKYSVRTASGDEIKYDENGMRVRYVEVPVVEERVVEKMLPVEIREVETRVPKIDYQVVEKIVEVPEIRYVERKVSKEVVEEVVRHVHVPKIVEVPKEVTKTVVVPETRVVEKIVEKPEIIEVPKPYKVEQKVSVPRYVNVEKPTVVAQKLRPLIRETANKEVVQAKTYEPMLYAVDVYIPKPIQSAFTAMGRVEETHGLVEIPAPQYNSLLRAMNSSQPDEALTDLYARGAGGVVPFLPVGELAEVVPPLAHVSLPGRHTASPVMAAARGVASSSSRSPSRKQQHRGRSRHRRNKRGRSASPSRRQR